MTSNDEVKAKIIEQMTAFINSTFESVGDGDKLPTASEVEKQFGKIWREYAKTSKKNIRTASGNFGGFRGGTAFKETAGKTKVPKDDVKPKREPSRYNLFLKEQMAKMKEEDADKPKEERRNSQAMLKIASAAWKNGAKDSYVPA